MIKTASALATSAVLCVALLGHPARADEGLDMAKRNHCTACHRVDRKLIGPAYLDVARKYAGDATAAERLEHKVKGGGVGVWGQIPMPPNDKVSDEDIKSLVGWILQLKASEPAATPPTGPATPDTAAAPDPAK